MALARALCAILFLCICVLTIEVGAAKAQEVPIPHLTPGSARSSEAKPASANAAPLAPQQTVDLTVAKGSPLQVALDEEVRIKKVGQSVHGRIVEPVYAFDHIVAPVG